jgi:hypothetical protein
MIRGIVMFSRTELGPIVAAMPVNDLERFEVEHLDRAPFLALAQEARRAA